MGRQEEAERMGIGVISPNTSRSYSHPRVPQRENYMFNCRTVFVVLHNKSGYHSVKIYSRPHAFPDEMIIVIFLCNRRILQRI